METKNVKLYLICGKFCNVCGISRRGRGRGSGQRGGGGWKSKNNPLHFLFILFSVDLASHARCFKEFPPSVRVSHLISQSMEIWPSSLLASVSILMTTGNSQVQASTYVGLFPNDWWSDVEKLFSLSSFHYQSKIWKLHPALPEGVLIPLDTTILDLTEHIDQSYTYVGFVCENSNMPNSQAIPQAISHNPENIWLLWFNSLFTSCVTIFIITVYDWLVIKQNRVVWVLLPW